MSIEESQEELFNRLLSDLEKSPEKIPASIFAAIKTPLPSLAQAALGMHSSSLNIIKLMKSGMFYKGGLKGRRLIGKKSFKVFFFKDLAYFVLRATDCIVSSDLLMEVKESYRHPEPFDKAIKHIEKLENIAEAYRSKSTLNKLTKIKKDLEDIKSYLLDKPIFLSAKIRKRFSDPVDKLISFFKDQLPTETPDYTIAGAISEMLKVFNISTELTAILRRMERK